MYEKRSLLGTVSAKLPAVAVFLVFVVMLATSLVCIIKPQPPDPPTTMPVPRMELHTMKNTRVAFGMDIGSVILSLPEHGQLVIDGQVITQDMLPFTLRPELVPERLVGR